MDIRDSIEIHCDKCYHADSEICSRCFFGSVDMGRKDLGNIKAYQLAFKYLIMYKHKGFKRVRPFGNFLNIEMKTGSKKG